MVLGVGTDILKIDRLRETSLRPGDSFLLATYTRGEIAQAAARADPFSYYATRFSGKEAVFKALGIDGERVRLCEIEILSDDNGRPCVTLHGSVRDAAYQRGVGEVLVSLSYDGGFAQAFAIAQTEAQPSERKTYERKPD